MPGGASSAAVSQGNGIFQMFPSEFCVPILGLRTILRLFVEDDGPLGYLTWRFYRASRRWYSVGMSTGRCL